VFVYKKMQSESDTLGEAV